MVSDKANGRYSRMLDTRSRMRTLIIAIVSAFSLLLSDLTPVWWTPDIQPSRAGRKVIYHHVQVLRTVQTRCRGPLRKQ